MFLEWKIAWRFLREGRSQTIFILAGIAIGIAVQVFLSSLINGLQADLINKTVGNSPHITALPKTIDLTSVIKDADTEVATIPYDNTQTMGKISNWESSYMAIKKLSQVATASAFLEGSGFIKRGQKEIPIVIRGMILPEANQIYKFSNSNTIEISGNEIMMGKSLLEELNLAIGDMVRINTLQGKQDLFTISHTFDLGNESLNSRWIIMDFQRTQKLLDLEGYATSLEIQLKDVFQSTEIALMLDSYYKDMDFESWEESNKQLLSALKSQASSSQVIQVFVLLAVALGISSVLVVSVLQKSKQIGILKAMGLTSISTKKIFLLQGGILGFTGSILGCGIGLGLIKAFQFFTAASGTSLFTITVNNSTFLLSIAVATFVGIISAIVPAGKSAKLNPIEVIRNG